MEEITFGSQRIVRGSIEKGCGIKDVISSIFNYYEGILPKEKDVAILLKPNLNNDLGGLTGTTTDLRILINIIKELHSRGYNNLIIGDGSNCGIFHSSIDIFKRLGIDKIAGIFGVKYVDFNHAARKKVSLATNSAYAAEAALDCNFFINLPKIKTHTEAILSLSCKNLIGCFTGYSKRNVHSKFHKNIYLLPKIFSPQLHIMDGLVAMEGNGPGAGKPVQMNTIFAATNPYLLDAYIARLMGIPFTDIGYLKIASDRGDIDPGQAVGLDMVHKEFGILMPEIIGWKNLLLSNWFVKPRYWKIFDWIFNTPLIDFMLLKLKIRQDIFIDSDAILQSISIDHKRCPEDCNRCDTFCPMNNTISHPLFQPDNENCIHCLYCYFVCRHGAVKVKGDLGYLKNHEERYKKFIEGL